MSEIGKRTVESFVPAEGGPFSANFEMADVVEDAKNDGNATLGQDLSFTHCGRCHVIGPRQPFVDHTGDWARAREIGDTGCLLVRPDHHVAYRATSLVDDPRSELIRILDQVLARA